MKNKAYDNKRTKFFIDPPYYEAGKRLYTHNDIDHAELFSIAKGLKAQFLMTYDNQEGIRALANNNALPYSYVEMKNSHHQPKKELIISSNLDWIN